MKSILFLFAFPSLISMQCSKSKIEIPSCIQNRIEEIKSKPKGHDASEINEYIYEGMQVFLFTSPCCDLYHPLYDSNCNYICAPTGGIAGSGDGKCADFFSTATYKRLVWKDDR